MITTLIELIEKKKEYNNKLSNLINQTVKEFEEDTGIKVHDIEIDSIDMSTMSKKEIQFIAEIDVKI